MKNVLFSFSKCEKKNQLKHKNQVRNRFILTVSSSSMNDNTCHYVVSTLKTIVYINFIKNNENFEIFCLNVTAYLNTSKSFLIGMFVVLASGKCDLHIHFTFLQEFSPPHIRKDLIFFSHIICSHV